MTIFFIKSNCLFKPIINPLAYYSINPLALENPDDKIHNDGNNTLFDSCPTNNSSLQYVIYSK